MFLKKFNDWPTPKITRILAIFGIILFIVIIPLMVIFYELSGYPVSFIESQLSFSGTVIKLLINTSKAWRYFLADEKEYLF